MDNFRESAGLYAADLQVSFVRARRIAWFVAFGWVVFPFVLATLVHPADMIRLQYVVQGERLPNFFTAQQVGVGFVETVFALGVLVMLQLVGTVLFYRQAQITDADRVATPALWPLAALLPGVIGNAIWFCALGYIDATGCVIGLAPAALTYLIERLCENLGREFVFGPRFTGQH
jgi:hypothetical protein